MLSARPDHDGRDRNQDSNIAAWRSGKGDQAKGQ